MTTTARPEYVTRAPAAGFEGLRARVRGEVLEPGEAGFAEAVTPWSLGHEHRPAAVIVADGVADLVAAVRFAAARGLPVAVQNTGHGPVRSCDGGLLLNVSRMNGVEVDPRARTVRVGPGAVWATVQAAAKPFGLAGLAGDTPSVGVAGFTLGGGTGWLGRKHGLACDSLLECELVTADGTVRTVNATSDPELFWALRGGGGGFGVVASMTLRLFPIERALCVQVVFPVERAAEALRAYRDWLENAPEELTSRAVFMRGPDIEAMPPFFRGRTGLALQLCYAGDSETGRALVAPVLALPGALAAPVVELAPADFFGFFGAPAAPTASSGWAGHLGALTDEALAAVLAHASLEPAPPFMMELRHLGGAARRVSEREAAYGHRGASFLANIHTMAPTPALAASTAPFVAAFAGALRPHTLGTVAPNFLNGDEGAERDRAAYPGERAGRLAAIKRRLDPENLFRFVRTPGSRSMPALA